mmetsp:Transcript_24316/g.26132  ORF Transcript_24316/g.26132 Transcript_24316/m.26132 type:complete len:93 (+) Transcript_24316:89-367(+)
MNNNDEINYDSHMSSDDNDDNNSKERESNNESDSDNYDSEDSDNSILSSCSFDVNSKSVVLDKVKLCGSNLRYASDELKGEKEVVIAALQQN